jgi:NDP-sugar pyrophosphorylase family protein
MDAVILAAGKGLRMRPLTETTPKPLLPLQGRPILDWSLGALPPSVDRVLVVVHYLAEQIEAYLRSQTHFREWVAVPQGEARGTGDAFRACRPHLRSERFLVMNGDDLYGAADLADLATGEAGVLCQTVNDPENWGIAVRRPDGSLERLVEKPKGLPSPQLANAGAYAFPREVFDVELKLSERGEYEITDFVTSLAARRPVRVVPARFWLPIGTPKALEDAQSADLATAMTRRS